MPKDAHPDILGRLAAFHPDGTEAWLLEYEKAYRRVEKGAPNRRIRWELSLAEFWDIVCRAQGRCEVTSTPFDPYFRAPTTNRRPFIPSLDRIDSTLGYNKQNTRLTVYICNIAMSDFGEEPFFETVKHSLHSPQFQTYIQTTEHYQNPRNYGHNSSPYTPISPVERYIQENAMGRTQLPADPPGGEESANAPRSPKDFSATEFIELTVDRWMAAGCPPDKYDE